MIILLSGLSDVARVALAEKLTENDESRRHFPLDQFEQMIPEESRGLFALDEEIAVGMMVSTILEMRKEGYDMVLSHPDAHDIVELLRQELGEEFISVHLGEEEEDIYDVVIETGDASVNEMMEVVENLISQKQS